MVDQFGIGGSNTYNCCSYGKLSLIGSTGSQDRTAVISKTANKVNDFYLEGIQAKTPEAGPMVFYKTLEGLELPENEEDYPMTAAKVVTALNDYIANPDEGVDTTGWCKWVENEDHLPVLDFNYEWDPTAGTDGKGAFVKVNN